VAQRRLRLPETDRSAQPISAFPPELAGNPRIVHRCQLADRACRIVLEQRELTFDDPMPVGKILVDAGSLVDRELVGRHRALSIAQITREPRPPRGGQSDRAL